MSSVEQALVGRDEKRAPLEMPEWEAVHLVVIFKKALELRHYPLCKKGPLRLGRGRGRGWVIYVPVVIFK